VYPTYAGGVKPPPDPPGDGLPDTTLLDEPPGADDPPTDPMSDGVVEPPEVSSSLPHPASAPPKPSAVAEATPKNLRRSIEPATICESFRV
jgi:hypothetical protein